MSDLDQVQALVDFAVERFGGLDIMFNNAGIGSPLTRFLHDDLEDFSRIMNVNLFGVIAGAQRAARYMKDHGGGSIINNASIAAINAGAGMIAYRASKAAIAHATKCMAIDLAPYAIRVNCLTPAHIRTGITTYDMGPVLRYMQPLERQAQPEDVANAVVFLSSDRAAQVTGIILPIDGGTTAGPPYAQTKLIMSTAQAGAGRSRLVTRPVPGGLSRPGRARGGGSAAPGGRTSEVLVGPGTRRTVLLLGDRDVGGAVEEAVEGHPALGPGERRSGARVDAVAERDVLPGVGAVDVELVRVLEHPGVAVGRRRARSMRLLPAGISTPPSSVRTRAIRNWRAERALEAQRLLDEVRDALAVLAHQLLQVRPLTEHPQREREQPHRGLLAAGEEVGGDQRHVVAPRASSRRGTSRWRVPSTRRPAGSGGGPRCTR